MLLEQITIENFRGAATPLTLTFESTVTVLTGANDAGKSSILDAIHFILGKRVIGEDDVNRDFMATRGEGAWTSDERIRGQAIFIAGGRSAERGSGVLQPGDRLHFSRTLAPSTKEAQAGRARLVEVRRAGAVLEGFDPAKNQLGVPRILDLNQALSEVRASVVLGQGSPTELRLQEVAFKSASEGVAKSFSGLSNAVNRRAWLNQGAKRMSEWTQTSMPNRGFTWQFDQVPGERNAVTLELLDSHRGVTPVSMRGRGLQRLLNILLALQVDLHPKGPTLILMDEPEESLHADSQRMLRREFEKLADRDNVQVIYATHSPAMINNARPGSVRLLERTEIDGVATVRAIDRAHSDNFGPVRTSLGMSLGDSLLFARVTVIVEGITEVYALPVLLQRLYEGGVSGFEDVPELLDYFCLFDGGGDGFALPARLARGFGVDVLVLLDSDKAKRAEEIKRDHPEIEVQLLPAPMEFENLVPAEVYVRAVSELVLDGTGVNSAADQITHAAFQKWLAEEPPPEKMMFSKRVDKWIRKRFPDLRFEKVEVMRKAALLVEPESIDAGPLRELLAGVRERLDRPDSTRG